MTQKLYEKIENIYDSSNSLADLQEKLERSDLPDEIRKFALECYSYYTNLRHYWNGMKLATLEGTRQIYYEGEVGEELNALRLIEYIGSLPSFERICLYITNTPIKNMDAMLELPFKDKIYVNYSGTDKYDFCSLDEFATMRATIDYYKSLVTGIGLSPLETVIYVYDLIRSYDYTESPTDIHDEQNIVKNITKGTISCYGYCQFMMQVLLELGFKSILLGVGPMGQKSDHSRIAIRITDSKYDLDDYFVFDPSHGSENMYIVQNENGYEKKFGFEVDNQRDKILKVYDKLMNYGGLFASLTDYSKYFPDREILHMRDYERHSIDGKDIEDYTTAIISQTSRKNKINIEKFIILLYNLKLAEGYPEEDLPNTIRMIFLLSLDKKVSLDRILGIISEVDMRKTSRLAA